MYPVFSHHIKSPYLRCVFMYVCVQFCRILRISRCQSNTKENTCSPFSHTSCECSGVRSREMFPE